MKRNEFIVAGALLTLVLYTFTLSAVATLQTSKTVPSTGTVKAIGVGVYQDSGCTKALSSIDWGTLEPGSSKNVSCYIRNQGNSPLTLSMSPSNWNPSTASGYMTLIWNYSGQSISPNAVIQVAFKLSISTSITGITSFSFDITIVGTS